MIEPKNMKLYIVKPKKEKKKKKEKGGKAENLCEQRKGQGKKKGQKLNDIQDKSLPGQHYRLEEQWREEVEANPSQ